MKDSIKISIVILTHNRLSILKVLLLSLSSIRYNNLEIIVVDNHSAPPVKDFVKSEFPYVKLLELRENLGVGGRNVGISSATGEIIITLDDDVIGINDHAIQSLIKIFADPKIGAVCFKVKDSENKYIINWCHHYPVEYFADKTFLTNEITEGAVAFRKKTLDLSGLYPEYFFISHEGPDLAYRIMNNGYNVIYSPEIIVIHKHSNLGRKNWRRYYFDTRNLWWLVVRNYSFVFGVKSLFVGISAMLIYSIRDGFFKYWLRGCIDGIIGLKEAYSHRSKPEKRTIAIVKEIEKQRPGFFIMLKKRLFQKEVSI